MRMDDDDNDDDTTTTAITTAGGTPARKKAKRKPPPPPEILESPEVAGGTVPEAAAASTASTASTAKKRTPAVAPLLQVDGLVDDSCKTKRDRPKRSKPEPRIARSKASLLREAGKLPPPPPPPPPPSSPSPSPVSASATAAGQAQPLPQQRPGLADPQSDGWPHTAKHEFFLTPTEIVVMEGVISGMKDCGIQMAIALNSADPDRMRSRSTVRAHLRHIFRKTGQAKRASAVAHILLKHIELQQTFIDQLHSEIDRLTEENQRLRGGGEQKIMKRMAGKK